MMKELIIKFEPFVFKQTIFIKDGDEITKEEIPQKELAKYISLCENLKTVHFFGNENFIRRIREECLTKYNLKNIDMVINR